MIVEDSDFSLQEQPSKNRFYTYVEKELLPFDPYSKDNTRGWAKYFGQGFQVIDQALPNRGLVFYILMTEMQELPSYGSNVFVFLLGDEFYRIPSYTNRVAGVFKCLGTRQIRQQIDFYRPFIKPSYFKVLLLGQMVRNLSLRLPLKINHYFFRLKNYLFELGEITPIFDVPVGYYNSEDLPIKPINSRAFDIFFEGSIVHSNYSFFSPSRWLKTPKEYSREQMFDRLSTIKEAYPRYNIKLMSTLGFAKRGSDDEDSVSYSQKMMDTKICVVPRGTTPETCRLFEAMRYGCVIISERLPNRWFYDGAPIIQLKDWDELECILPSLLGNEALLETLHQQTLDWWQNKCCEEVVGWYCAEKINALLSQDRVFIPVPLRSALAGQTQENCIQSVH